METKFGKVITSKGFVIVFPFILIPATFYMCLRISDAIARTIV